MRYPRGVAAALAVAALAGGLLAVRAPRADAAITSAAKSCGAVGDGSFDCTLTVQGSVAATDVVQVTQTGGTFNQVSYVSGCASAPAVATSNSSFSITAPADGCAGPIVFSENVAASSVPGTLVENVVENMASGAQVATAQASTDLAGLTGSKSCHPSSSAASTYSCTLSFQPSGTLSEPAMVSVTSSGGTLTSVQYQGGCASTPTVMMSGSGFSFTAPTDGCVGPIVFGETVTGQPGTITQTVEISGSADGSASFSAQLTASSGSGDGNGSGDDNGHGGDNGHGDDGNGQGGNGQGNNGNGHNHTVPACQNSHGRAPQKNPHCHDQGGDGND